MVYVVQALLYSPAPVEIRNVISLRQIGFKLHSKYRFINFLAAIGRVKIAYIHEVW